MRAAHARARPARAALQHPGAVAAAVGLGDSTPFETPFEWRRGFRVEEVVKLNPPARQGVDKSRILIKIASTWEGIQVPRHLPRVFSLLSSPPPAG